MDGLFPPIVPGLAGPDHPPGWQIAVAKFWEMARLGIFGEKDPVCLWRGHLSRRPIPTREHCVALNSLYKHFLRIPPDPGTPHAESRQPLNLTREESVLMPDASIIRGRMTDYPERHPVPADLLLVAEVIDMPNERLLAEVYAAEGIPVYWEISLARRRLTMFHGPNGSLYAGRRVFDPSDEVPVVIAGRVVASIPVADLLP